MSDSVLSRLAAEQDAGGYPGVTEKKVQPGAGGKTLVFNDGVAKVVSVAGSEEPEARQS